MSFVNKVKHFYYAGQKTSIGCASLLTYFNICCAAILANRRFLSQPSEMSKFFIKIIFIISCLFIAGCGFHLRDSSLLTPSIRIMYLKTATPYSIFSGDLRQNLCALGVRIVNDPCKAPITLHILSEKFQEDRITISATSLLSQYLLVYEVCYQLEKSNGCILVAPRKIRVTRNYTVNANQILGASNELPLLKEDMSRELAYQLINQLSSTCVREATCCYCMA